MSLGRLLFIGEVKREDERAREEHTTVFIRPIICWIIFHLRLLAVLLHCNYIYTSNQYDDDDDVQKCVWMTRVQFVVSLNGTNVFFFEFTCRKKISQPDNLFHIVCLAFSYACAHKILENNVAHQKLEN